MRKIRPEPENYVYLSRKRTKEMTRHIFNEFGQDRIILFDIDKEYELTDSVRLHNFHLIMITDGELTVDVNHRIFQMKPMLTISH